MTVTYPDSSFKRLLFWWKGSIWKSIWDEFLIFTILYVSLNLTYRVGLTRSASARDTFEKVVLHIREHLQYIPLQFLLGFYVSYIVGRWWEQLMHIPVPDKLLYLVSANFPGEDEENRLIRRTIARWVNLHSILTWRETCLKIKKRFPTEEHVLKAQLMTQEEYDIYVSTTDTHGRWFSPISWVINLLTKCRKEGKITDYSLQVMVLEAFEIRNQNSLLALYDWVSPPLRYTQVATMAAYGYFALCLVGRQSLMTTSAEIKADIYLPIFTLLEFVFYIGWLKVAEEYQMPFGEDDDDFDMNYIVDKDMHVANMIIDEMCYQNPTPTKDKDWDNKHPFMPHTVASYPSRDGIPEWRLGAYTFEPDETEMLPLFDPYKDPPGGVNVKGSKAAAEEKAKLLEKEAKETKTDGNAV